MQTPFFERRYFTIFLVIAVLLFPILRGARRAIESNTNNVKDWLPHDDDVSQQLGWFQKHFPGQQFSLVSWDGCTLGNQEQLNLLAKKLVPKSPTPAGLKEGSNEWKCRHYFNQVISGPDQIARLQDGPLGLSEGVAIRRLEGALVGPRPEGAEDNSARTTCLIVTLKPEATKNNRNLRDAIETIEAVAKADCGLPKDMNIRMGGPPVDNVAIDIEGQRTLTRLAALAGLVGIGLAYWCLRCWYMTWIVFAVGVMSAALSLAFVYYYGLFEVAVLGYETPRFGTADAILMSMPAVVYVLGISGSIHIINYYRDAVAEHGLRGAAEEAVSHGWKPCTLAALTTAIGLGSLCLSDITPIKKFGIFTAAGVMGTLTVLFTLLPAALYRFGPKNGVENQGKASEADSLPGWAQRIAGFIISRNKLVFGAWILLMVVVGLGLPRIQTTVQLLKLFDSKADIIQDYAWLETHLGNLVPMEVVLRFDPEAQRPGEEHPEENGQQYRMTLLERLEMVRRVSNRMERMKEIDKTLSAVDFAPNISLEESPAERVFSFNRDYTLNQRLEAHRKDLLKGDWSDYVKEEEHTLAEHERNGSSVRTNNQPAELWRISARVGALNDVDYGVFIDDLRHEIEPLVAAYRWRDMVVRKLHKQGRELHQGDKQAKVCVLYRSDATEKEHLEHEPAVVLSELLKEAGALARAENLTQIQQEFGDGEEVVRQFRETLAREYDCVVIAGEREGPIRTDDLVEGLPTVVDTDLAPTVDAQPSVAAVYTGVVPLVYQTQHKLLLSLQESVGAATLFIAVVMMFVLKSPIAGLASMIPNVFPIVLLFGAMGWVGYKVDIGTMMAASVALGVAVDDTIHFLYWFRHGMEKFRDQRRATMEAYNRCARAMTQTTIIGGLGLAVFAFSSFTPTQQFGYLMVTMLTAALVGDLLLLPAILAGPVGRFFSGRLKQPPTVDTPDEPGTPVEAPHKAARPHVPPLRYRQDAPHRSAPT